MVIWSPPMFISGHPALEETVSARAGLAWVFLSIIHNVVKSSRSPRLRLWLRRGRPGLIRFNETDNFHGGLTEGATQDIAHQPLHGLGLHRFKADTVIHENHNVHEDVRKIIEKDPGFATEYFKDLMTRPMLIQLAKAVKMKQSNISRMENVDADHLLSLTKRVAEKLGAHLAIVPPDMVYISKDQLKRLNKAA